ncbi:MAG: glycosyltransferase [Saprospiraceae bacterium]|nr:glycosyltransferase [Pyrinomonadaceae bacterium]
MSSTPPKKNHLLTVLVEDYFQVGAFEKLIRQRNWSNFEPRYERNTLKTLDLLDEFDTKGTFFILGWIAEQNPGFVREIASRGHEIASRGYYHRSLKNLTADEFREDLRRTNRVLEDASGQKIIGYRSAEKLTFGQDEWIFDVLAEEGFVYDASFQPKKRTEKNSRFAHKLNTNGTSLWEFPYSTRDFGVGLLPISGGNYFRQIPYTLMRHAVADWDKSFEEPFVFYFHVWELDPEQPRISAASRYNRIRHYRKLDKMEWIIRENLSLYNFTDAAGFLGIKDDIRIALHDPKGEALQLPSAASVSRHETEHAVTIVIPCYNEQEALPYLANTLRSVEARLTDCGYTVEFIFVDDCSKDETFEILTELFDSKENVRIVKHEVNRGVAAGIMTGLRAAGTEIVCSMDCDCTYDPHELAEMVPLLHDDVDMVTASPYHRMGGVRNVPGWRLFLSKGASFLYRRVLRSKMDTYTSCFRVYRKSSMNGIDLKRTGFLGVAEMLGKLDLRGGKIVEFPAVLEVRLFGLSKMKTVKTIAGHISLLGNLAKMRWFGKIEPIQPYLAEGTLTITKENLRK